MSHPTASAATTRSTTTTTASSGAGVSSAFTGLRHHTAEQEDEGEEEHDALWSADMIRRAAADLNLTTNMKQYERRLALREMKDLIRKATEKSSGILVKPNVAAMLSQQGDSAGNCTDAETREQFVALREELTRLLALAEANELRVADMCRIMQECWRQQEEGCYTPLDILDVMVLGGGSGAASSDMIVDAIKILHRCWTRAAADATQKRALQQQQQQQRNNEESATAAGAGSLGEAIFGLTQPVANSSTTTAQPSTRYDEMELAADFVAVLSEFQVPRSVQNQLFNQLRDKSPDVRCIRLAAATARANACLLARDRFVGMLRDVSMMMNQRGVGGDAAAEDELVNSPELFDLAEDLVPRLKAWEVAAGFPFFVDESLAVDLHIMSRKRVGGDVPSVTTVLTKILERGY